MGVRTDKAFKTVKAYIRSRVTVCPDTGCWLWGKITKGNYGWFVYGNIRGKCAHVHVYEIYKRSVPKGKIVRHTCDDTRCVNPKHLITGTKKDNRRDFMERHPKAMELIQVAAKCAQAGCKRFWAGMSAKERKEFCERRSAIQDGKGNRGHSKETKAKIKLSWVKRKKEGLYGPRATRL